MNVITLQDPLSVEVFYIVDSSFHLISVAHNDLYIAPAMSLVRNVRTVLRISSAYRSPILWTRSISSAPVPSQPEESKPKPVSHDPTMGIRASHKPDNLERRFLVWTGRYKTVDDVPEYVR